MELTAAKFALLAFYPHLYGVPVSEDPSPSVGVGNRQSVGSQNLAIPPLSHIRFMMDNTTAISYLRRYEPLALRKYLRIVKIVCCLESL